MTKENASDTSTSAGQAGAGGDTTTQTNQGDQGNQGSSSVLTGDGTGGDGGDGDKGKSTDKDGGTTVLGDAKQTEELKITLPEGLTVDEKILGEFSGLAKEVGLDSEKASKLATWYAEMQEGVAKYQQEAIQQQSQDWEKELRDDPDFGRQKFDESAALARRAVLQFGGKELAQALDQLGIGNHPVLARTFLRIGRSISEDSLSGKSSGNPPPKADIDAKLKRMYHKSQPETG